MLGHEYKDMPGRSTEIGANPRETVMMLRCTWCLKAPTKAREDGCPVHELDTVGSIVLSEYNPDGIERFGNRLCVTCERPIMGHFIRRNLPHYWCYENQNMISDGMNETTWDIPTDLQTKYIGGIK